MAVRIGELLLKEKRITPEQLQEALAYQKANGGKLGLNLVKLGFVKDEDITALLSKQYGVPSINLGQFEIDPAVIKLIPAETAQKYQIIPLSRSGATLTIAMTDPTNVFAMDDIKFMTGYNVEPVVASETAVNDALRALLRDARPRSVDDGARRQRRQRARAGGARRLEEMPALATTATSRSSRSSRKSTPRRWREQGEEAPVIKLVNVILMSAIQKGASDIHIEPYEKEFRSATASTASSTTSCRRR